MTSFQFAQLMFVTQSVLIGAAVSLTSQAFSADGGDRLSGIASVYDQSSGAQTASGELCEEAMTAAHRSLRGARHKSSEWPSRACSNQRPGAIRPRPRHRLIAGGRPRVGIVRLGRGVARNCK
jgi:hypothetical protein